VLIRFTQSARRHKIGTTRVRHVLTHTTVAFTIPGGDGKAERTVWLGAMRTRGRPTPHTTAGQSRAVSVRMNPELLHQLHTAAAARHVPISTLIREATAQWLHHHAS